MSDEDDKSGNVEMPAIAIAYQAEVERLCAELAAVEKQRTELVSVLSQLVAVLDARNGFATTHEQMLLRHARVLLLEILR